MRFKQFLESVGASDTPNHKYSKNTKEELAEYETEGKDTTDVLMDIKELELALKLKGE